MLDSKWLLWAGIAILVGAGVVLYFKLYGLASIFGVTGVGIVAFAYNPWLLTLSGIGAVALIAYSVYTGRPVRPQNQSEGVDQVTIPTVAWNEASPAGTASAGQGDDRIREFKTQVRE
jgi:cell division protein FtsW (lipid II flippase)